MQQKSKSKTGRAGFTPARRSGFSRPIAAKSVSEFVPALMRPSFEKYGFPAAAILTDWPAIAGPALAAFTSPERLKWPRRSQSGADGNDQKGATLVLRVSGPRALEVEHCRGALIERINAAFGYRAVTAIRILQAPVPRSEVKKPPIGGAPTPECSALLADLPEDRLRNALSRIATGVKLRQSTAEAV